MKLVKINDVYINLDHVTSIEFDKYDTIQLRVTVYFSHGGSKTFYRSIPYGQTLSQSFDRFIDELQNKPVVEI